MTIIKFCFDRSQSPAEKPMPADPKRLGESSDGKRNPLYGREISDHWEPPPLTRTSLVELRGFEPMAIASYSRPPLRMAARVSSAPVSDLGRDDLAGRGAFIAASKISREMNDVLARAAGNFENDAIRRQDIAKNIENEIAVALRRRRV
jgi:hypothetical protein